MKHQQVIVDYWNMMKASFTCLLLAFSGYILIKMVQTIFWLPGYLQKNQKHLEELAAHYSLELNAAGIDDDIDKNSHNEAAANAEERQPLIEQPSGGEDVGLKRAEVLGDIQEPKKHK